MQTIIKKVFFTVIGLIFCCVSYTQITILRTNGIPAVLDGDTKANKSSSLTREWIILNDGKCPVQLRDDVGIKSSFSLDSRSFCFYPFGSIETSEPITAYEIHHVLYDVFGEHLVTLSNVEIADINGSSKIEQDDSWYGTENQMVEYLSCVSYVATVRTKAGTIWRYKPLVIMTELNKIQIPYKEDYRPSTETEKK
jgi:hypothetical protein